MLADIDAVHRILGSRRTKAELGLPPRARGVEQLTDPKSTLKAMLEIALGDRRARKIGIRPLYGALGAETSIAELRSVPAFVRFETEFRDALAALGFLGGRPASGVRGR